MKFSMELVLVALLLVLIYEKPPQLVAFSSTTLGKAVLIGVSVLISRNFGLNAGILAAVAIILLFEAKHEGLGTGGSSRVRENRRKLEAARLGSAGSSKKPSSKKCKNDADCGTCSSVCENKKCSLEGKDYSQTSDKSCSTDKDCGACEANCTIDGECVISSIDRVSLDRQMKENALVAGMAAAQQSNDQTNNGTSGATERFGNYF